MSELTREALMFEGRVEEVIQTIRREVSERTEPRQLQNLHLLKEEYDLLPEKLKEMIGYNPKDFRNGLETLIDTYTNHIQKNSWAKLSLSVESLHSKERTEIMVATAMFNDQKEPTKESWLERARKGIFN